MTEPAHRRRWALVACTLAVMVPSCLAGSQGDALARQACGHVVTGLSDYHRAVAATGEAAQTSAEVAALEQFQVALPLAARAAEDAGRWQALMTTLQEVNRVPVKDLVTALDVQCSNALGHPVH